MKLRLVPEVPAHLSSIIMAMILDGHTGIEPQYTVANLSKTFLQLWAASQTADYNPYPDRLIMATERGIVLVPKPPNVWKDKKHS